MGQISSVARSHAASLGSLALAGIAGLYNALAEVLTPMRLSLAEGVPRSRKATLAMQFLMEGVRREEHVPYLTLSESEDALRDVAISRRCKLEGRTIRDFRMAHSAGRIGPSLRKLRGVLTGLPIHEKDEKSLRTGNRP